MKICTIGIDLGKTVFHLVGETTQGEVVVRKKCSRIQLLRFTSNLRDCLIGIFGFSYRCSIFQRCNNIVI